jgi:hypothetical protein
MCLLFLLTSWSHFSCLVTGHRFCTLVQNIITLRGKYKKYLEGFLPKSKFFKTHNFEHLILRLCLIFPSIFQLQGVMTLFCLQNIMFVEWRDPWLAKTKVTWCTASALYVWFLLKAFTRRLHAEELGRIYHGLIRAKSYSYNHVHTRIFQ